MPDRNKKFNNLALNSSLFKGRTDWYFCYLKGEKIAHVLSFLAQRNSHPSSVLEDASNLAATVPSAVVHFAAGNKSSAAVLAIIFSLISQLRFATTNKALHTDNASVLIQELEQIIERLAGEYYPSPTVSAEHFLVPPLGELAPIPLAVPSIGIKDIHKGHYKGQVIDIGAKGQHPSDERVSLILSFIRKSDKKVSIKDIAKVVTGFSDKTLQRELGSLVAKGLIKKEGERRWSVYVAV